MIMRKFLREIRLPAVAMALAVVTAWRWRDLAILLHADGMGIEIIRDVTQVAASLIAALVLVRLLRLVLWEGLYPHRTGVPAPRLFVFLVDALVLVAAGALIVAFVFKQPVGGLITTSGVAVAVVGFALKSLISDLFSGIAMTMERAFDIGDIIEISGGATGEIRSMSWRTTGLRLIKNDHQVLVPNSRLSDMVLTVYKRHNAPFRDEILITLGHQITAQQVERLLLSAPQNVPEVVAIGKNPDVTIMEFGSSGVTWRLRYWVPNYQSRYRLRATVHRKILNNLQLAGVSPASPFVTANMVEPDRAAPVRPAAAGFLARVPLFSALTEAEFDELAAGAQQQILASGHAVVRHGAEGASLFVIQEGLLEVVIPDADGREKMVGHLEPGAFFGEMSLLTGAPRAATVRTTGGFDSVVIEITKQVLAPIVTRRPELLEAIGQVVAERQLKNDQARAALVATGDSTAQQKTLAAQLLGIMRNFFSFGQIG